MPRRRGGSTGRPGARVPNGPQAANSGAGRAAGWARSCRRRPPPATAARSRPLPCPAPHLAARHLAPRPPPAHEAVPGIAPYRPPAPGGWAAGPPRARPHAPRRRQSQRPGRAGAAAPWRCLGRSALSAGPQRILRGARGRWGRHGRAVAVEGPSRRWRKLTGNRPGRAARGPWAGRGHPP